ncbi:hypothetical protein [Flexivirga caeni]|nr:hypothetical protein [Flexivirga caeni]
MLNEPLDPREIVSTAAFLRRGIKPSRLAAGKSPVLARVRAGEYLSTDRWVQLSAAERHRALIYATTARMRSPLPMLYGVSAGIMLRLPIIGKIPQRVQVLLDARAAGSSTLVQRHRAMDLPGPMLIDGIPVTPPARTVVDLARTMSLACALAAGDWAVRLSMCGVADITNAALAVPCRGHGRAIAILAARLVDPRSESPGESLSRARMYENGFPEPDLQVPLLDERGEFGRGDFGWPGLIGEFDGLRKYRATGDAGNMASEEVVIREKRREDRARRAGWGFARWVWSDAFGGAGLTATLLAGGLERSSTHRWGRDIEN